MAIYFKSVFIILILILFTSCTKEVPQEMQNKPKLSDQQNMPNDSIHKKFMSTQDQGLDSKSDSKINSHSDSKKETGDKMDDEKAFQLTKEADDADAKYQKTNAEKDKDICIEKQMEAANYLMFDSDLPPKEKYKPALFRYKRVLELDPGNKEAKDNKDQIEEIYRSMGKPIPQG